MLVINDSLVAAIESAIDAKCMYLVTVSGLRLYAIQAMNGKSCVLEAQ